MCIVTSAALGGATAAAGSATAASAASAAMMANLAIAGMAVSAATTGLSFYGQAQQAAEQQRVMNDRYRAVGDAASSEYRFNLGQLAIRDEQEFAAASLEMQKVSSKNAANVSTAKTVLSARGLGGAGVKGMLDTYRSLEYTDAYVMDRNIKWRRQQGVAERQSMAAGFQSRMAGAAPNKVGEPSTAALVASLGSDLFHGINDFNRGLTTEERAAFWGRSK
jgi:hypothetical protein